MTGAARPRRGVVLNELDRQEVHLLAYSGRRWEVVGTLREHVADPPALRPVAGAGERSEPSTVPAAASTVVQGPWSAAGVPGHPRDRRKPPGPLLEVVEGSGDMPPF